MLVVADTTDMLLFGGFILYRLYDAQFRLKTFSTRAHRMEEWQQAKCLDTQQKVLRRWKSKHRHHHQEKAQSCQSTLPFTHTEELIGGKNLNYWKYM